MRVETGQTTVSSAGTRVQLNNVTNRVKFIKAKALAGNSGVAYVGISDVASTNGYELSAGNELELTLGSLADQYQPMCSMQMLQRTTIR